MLCDEFDFINKITPTKTFQSSLVKGIGDDAAVFSSDQMFDELICVDTMVEGVHFTKQTMSPFMIGYKALAVNISDIAAMGGIPTYYLVSIAISNEWTEEDLKQVYAGMKEIGSYYSMDLIGGDTVSCQHGLIITVTVCGKVEKGKSLYRSNAKAGDVIFVVGEVGASSAGLDLLLKNGCDHHYTEAQKNLLNAHQMPLPQVKAGRLLVASGEKIALNDISDGLASETNEIAVASKVDLYVHYEKIPKSTYINTFDHEKQKKWSLFGGEDYTLVGTMPKDAYRKINQTFDQNKIKITIIGEVKAGIGTVYLVDKNKVEKLPKQGFNHFSKGEEHESI